MTLSYNNMHEVIYHMGQPISHDSDVNKSRISRTPPIHKNATIVGCGWYHVIPDNGEVVASRWVVDQLYWLKWKN